MNLNLFTKFSILDINIGFCPVEKMLKNIILSHKKEKVRILASTYIERERLKGNIKAIKHNLIKVIIGPRRSGKSVFATQLLQKEDFAYLNFDDENLLKLNDYDEIIKGILEVYKDPKFLLFDEIQNLKNWELFTNKLQRRGFNLVLTGSNANLLSKELSTHLTGRFIPIEIFPFSFNEFLIAKNYKIIREELELPETKGKILNYLNEYLITGGFPEVIVKNLDTKSYLDTLFDSVLLKDIIKRYKIRFSQNIYELSNLLISNYASEFSYRKFKNILDIGSVTTVQNYIKYIEEAYLIYSLNRYNFKVKEQIKAPKKLHLVDNGFIQAKANQPTYNIGKQLENLIFTDLIKKGTKPNLELFYYKTRNGKEIDFILKKGGKVKKLIQVSYEISALETNKREIKALLEAGEELNCNNFYIITWDTEKKVKAGKKIINFIPAWKWLFTEDRS